MALIPMEYGGGLIHNTVATSATSGTYGQKLAELKSAFTALSENARMRTILQWYSLVFQCQDTAGIFTSITSGTIYIFDVNNGKAYTRDLSNGTLSDISNSSTGTYIRLYQLDEA